MGKAVKKDVLLITNYYHFEEEKKSSRYRTLAEMISARDDLTLEVVTSTFYHQTKKQRNTSELLRDLPFRVTFCREEGYSRNISLQRLKSCRTFGKSVLNYLEQRERPDVIYQVVPSLDVADEVSAYAKRHHIPLIIDVQDLWPEAFRMALDIPVMSDILFAPMMWKANRIYSRADHIVAVSDTYVRRAAAVNRQCSSALSVYIGTDIDYAYALMNCHPVEKPKDEFWLTYVGALGHSYDIPAVIKAIALLKQRGISNVVFHVLGDGVLKETFCKEAQKQGVDTRFHGFVEYGEMMAMLAASDAAVNPIVGKSVSSIINKVSDYAVAGVPVINTQNSAEYRALLEEYQCGINCENGNIEALAAGILRLYEDDALRAVMRENSARLGREKFSRRETYRRIVELIAEA